MTSEHNPQLSWRLIALLVAMPLAAWASNSAGDLVQFGVAIQILVCWFALAIYLHSWIIGGLAVGTVLVFLAPHLGTSLELIGYGFLAGLVLEMIRMWRAAGRLARKEQTQSPART